MFVDFPDYDTTRKTIENHLMNLDEVLLIVEPKGTYDVRNDKTNKVESWYRVIVYYTGKGNSWTFYYPDERTQHQHYLKLRKALQDAGKLPEDKVEDPILVEETPNEEDWTSKYLGNRTF